MNDGKKTKKPVSAEEELAQEVKKVVLGDKIIESRLPSLCRKVGAEGIVLLKNDAEALPRDAEAEADRLGQSFWDEA